MLTIFLFLQEQAQKVSRNTAEVFSELYREFLPSDFNRYFQSEMNAIGDRTLSQEVAILNTLSR